MLTVSAKDFGPIIEGTVNLKPLTVFVGPSNTGKSYMATLIYALMQAYRVGDLYNMDPYSAIQLGAKLAPLLQESISEEENIAEFSGALDKWIRAIEAEGLGKAEHQFDTFPSEVQSYIGGITETWLKALNQSVPGELQKYHGGIEGLLRRSQDSLPIEVGVEQGKPLFRICFRNPDGQLMPFAEEYNLSESRLTLPPELLRTFLISPPNEIQAGILSQWSHYSIVFTMVVSIMYAFLDGFRGNSYYLPAARSGIAQGHRIIASTLVKQSPLAGLQRMEVPQFPGVIADFMGHMLALGQTGNQELEPELKTTIDFLEYQVIRGKIDLEETGQITYPDISYEPFVGQPSTGKFSLNQTSSMVSELAPIILFLRYLVRPGDLLILEEPESHLHPQAQRQMARGIVRLVNAGVKVLITTHSDYFLNQVNNLLRISFASDRWLKREGFAREDCLKHDDVSAYVFEWDGEEGGSRVRELEIRKDVGIDDEEFGKVVNAQYEETILVEGIPLR